MADTIAVKGATVSLTPVITTVLITTKSHTLSVVTSGPFVSALGNEILLEEDVDASFATFTTPYTNPPYVNPPGIGGSLKYQSLKSISNLSELTHKNGSPIVTTKTQGTITCSVVSPAIQPPPPPPGTPDSTLTYDLDFSFTAAGQTLAGSD